MTDPFLNLPRSPKRGKSPTLSTSPQTCEEKQVQSVGDHALRKHSKFSASGAERYAKCLGSVELSEGMPDKSSPWAEEGTKAHEVLETWLKAIIDGTPVSGFGEMHTHAATASRFIKELAGKTKSEILVETKIYLDFIHPEMFGTFDSAVLDHFGTLHVFDYKYGAGVFVSPVENLQMIFYGVGLAHLHHWNFKKVRLWIIQPRVKGYDGPLFWELSVLELKAYVDVFRRIVDRVIKEPGTFVEGSHCHWCKAKSVCPLKRERKLEQARSVFSIQPWKGE